MLTQESAATTIAGLEVELRSARERCEMLVAASLSAGQEAGEARVELQRQVGPPLLSCSSSASVFLRCRKRVAPCSAGTVSPISLVRK